MDGESSDTVSVISQDIHTLSDDDLSDEVIPFLDNSTRGKKMGHDLKWGYDPSAKYRNVHGIVLTQLPNLQYKYR